MSLSKEEYIYCHIMNNNNCISPNVGRYYGVVTGPPPPPAMEATMEAMEAMEAAATERFRRLLLAKKKIFSLVCWSVCLSKRLSVCCSFLVVRLEPTVLIVPIKTHPLSLW